MCLDLRVPLGNEMLTIVEVRVAQDDVREEGRCFLPRALMWESIDVDEMDRVT